MGTLTAREEELMNTNDGYVYLTEHLHEGREELEEKIEQLQSLNATLGDRNQELLDEGLKLRQEIGELKRRLAEAEKAARDAAAGLPTRFSAAGACSSPGPVAYPEPKSSTEKKKKGEDGEEYGDDFDDDA